ncbi:hypothetical protein AAC387_Pa01g1118 [Persea americana]
MTSSGKAPYLGPSGHLAPLSSGALRRSKRAHRGCHRRNFSISSLESNVVRLTPTPAAYLIWASALHGLAYTIWPAGTPRAKTASISARLAQSKPAPRAASAPRIAGSGLHLTA